MVNIFIPTEVWNMLVSRTYEFLDTHLQEKREMYEVGERVFILQVYSFLKCINSFNYLIE